MCTCCDHEVRSVSSLSFETLLTDPMTRMVMESDGVSIQDLIHVLERARDAIALRNSTALLPQAA